MTPGLFRLFLAFVVVLHHSFPLRMGGWAVGMFFALSGFWISRMWRSKYGLRTSPWKEFLLSRWWRLAPVFLTVNFFAAVLIYSGFSVGNEDAVDRWVWWLSQPAVAGSTQFTRLLPPAWSLDVEMQFYIVAPLIVIAIASLRRGVVTLLCFVLFAWSVLCFSRGSAIETARLDLYAWIFVAGCAVERFSWRPSRRLAMASALLVVAMVAVPLCIPQTRGLVWSRGGNPTQLPEMAGTGFFVLAVLVGLPFAMDTVYRESGSWDRWLGDLSYPLYMFHWIPRDAYYAHVDWSLPAWRNGLLLLANFSVALLGAVLLLQVVDRPAQCWRGRWLDRGRVKPTAAQEIAAADV